MVIIPPSLTNPAALLTPSAAVVWVNSLWFLCLTISLTCAFLATLLQQWARRYLRITNPRYGLRERVRIRAFFAEGVERLRLPRTVEALTILVHISLFLFFAGLGVFLFGVHRTAFSVVIASHTLYALFLDTSLPVLVDCQTCMDKPLSPQIYYAYNLPHRLSPPPVQSSAQVFPVHHGVRPTDLYTTHDDHSAPQLPSTGASTAPNIPVLQIPLTPGPFTTQPKP
ncbi:hypothetical protein EDB83DRAFT_2527521 [Lactarius deliciosus]|nr:hypothetical protein EDB83DRAFT_2527521 [Lactarius deliciosus]